MNPASWLPLAAGANSLNLPEDKDGLGVRMILCTDAVVEAMSEANMFCFGVKSCEKWNIMAQKSKNDYH